MTEASADTRGSRSAAAMQRRRQDILDAAVDLFNDKGYLGATTDKIAEAASVTKRTLYRHMGTKQHILLEIHANFIDEGLRRWQAVVERGGTPTEVVENLVREHIRTVAQYQKAIRVFFEESKHLDADDRAEIIEQRDRYEGILYDALKRGIQSGDFTRLDAKTTTLVLLGALTEIYRWYRPGTAAQLRELSEFVIQMFGNGIRAAD
jgi:AcrR family transcriptional regulator